MAGKIRLGCVCCGRDDFDCIDELPSDWADIEEVRSYERSIEPVPQDQNWNKFGDSVTDWETHLGTCPDCEDTEEFAP